MGRRPEQTFLQKRHTDGQKEHEKMFRSINYWRNANKNSMRYHLTPARMAIIKKTTNNKAGEDVKRRGPTYTVNKNVNWYSQYGEQYGVSLKKLKK